MAQDKIKKPMTDPVLEGTGQPGELADTPRFGPGVQDPTLFEQGIEQPGELMGTPDTPDPDFLKEVEKNKQKTDEEIMESLAFNIARFDVGKNFSMWDIADDLGLQFNKFDKGEKQ